MDVITAVRKEKRTFYLTVNDSETVKIPSAIMRERPMTEGTEFDLEEYDQWLMVRQYRFALDRAVGYLAARPCSAKEIYDKLIRAGYRPCTCDMVLYKLRKEKLLNDEEFALQWAEIRARHRLGPQRIRQELRRKGISEEQTQLAIEALDEDEQLQSAITLVKKGLLRAKKDEEPRKTAARLAAMLARRGYGWETAKKAIAAAINNEEVEFDE
ncbi:MAG: regulatory protein RecX [Clostridia bacterium]|nr:regulatory protein RecX [Clostridia bacterium]